MIQEVGQVIYVFIIFIWCLVGAYSTWYLHTGVSRSAGTVDALREQQPERSLELNIAQRRLERERVLLYVEYALLLSGLIAAGLILIPEEAAYRPLLRITIPVALVVAHALLGVHSYQIHAHHHELMNKITGRLLKEQFETRTKSKVKDVTITQVDQHQIAVAVVQPEEEGEE